MFPGTWNLREYPVCAVRVYVCVIKAISGNAQCKILSGEPENSPERQYFAPSITWCQLYNTYNIISGFRILGTQWLQIWLQTNWVEWVKRIMYYSNSDFQVNDFWVKRCLGNYLYQSEFFSDFFTIILTSLSVYSIQATLFPNNKRIPRIILYL